MPDRPLAVVDDAAAEGWLREHRAGAPPEEVLRFFDARPPVRPEDLRGRWRGSEVPTGSPLDGLLEAYGWWGKEFLDAETVHPLLFSGRGQAYPVNPALVPLWLPRTAPGLARSAVLQRAAAAARPLLRTRRPTARLRMVEHRGVVSAGLIYDSLPVIDVFRAIDDDVVLGLMDMRGLDAVLAFVLRRQQCGAIGTPTVT